MGDSSLESQVELTEEKTEKTLSQGLRRVYH